MNKIRTNKTGKDIRPKTFKVSITLPMNKSQAY